MRKTLSFLIFFFAFSIAQYMSAQAPQAITYQSVVRDSQGKLLVNTPIDVHVSILRQSVDGEVVYAESHSAVTNNNGLLSLLIGYGNNVSGSFAAIQWHTSVFYLRSDIFLPSNQVPLTTIMQFVSVPYALSSAVADTAMSLKMGNTLFTGSYNQLMDLPTMPTVPTQVSAFVNDAGYLTHDSLPTAQPIPTQISAFVNDAGYLTHDSLPAIPTQVSVLDNDAGYLTAEYQTISDVATLGNDMGNKQLKGLQDPTESQDAVTYHLLQDVQGLIAALQTRIDSLNHVVDSMQNIPVNPVFTLPTITTALVINVSDTEALIGGNLLSSGGAMVTARGVCWTSDSLTLPTIAHCDGVISDSACQDSFSVLVTGLNKGTTYYARAYASNFLGISYGDVVSFVAQEPCDSTFGGSTVTKGNKGALPGLFSVSYNKKVYFSAGNLQYSTRGTHDCIDGTRQPGTWCFANNQYDYIGCSNRYIEASYSGWIDLFGWGTSGYHNPSDSYNTNYYPYSSSISEVKPSYNDYGYGPSFTMADNNLVGSSANYDWGVYNAISNGGNTPGMWRTLTLMEWAYLYLARPDASSKWGSATVSGNHGVIFLPDEWTLPEGSVFTPGSEEEWLTNVYSDSQWMAMENAGALFLPAAGYRLDHDVDDAGVFSYYWSSSVTNSGCADYLNFGSLGDFGMYYYASHVGLSVRLVCDEKPQRSLPTVSTATASVVVNTGAVLGGEVISDGGSAITARGVCWDTISTPTVNSCLGMTVDGTGVGQFSSIATGLDDGTTYYVRAYATSDKGTVYGNTISFTTDAFDAQKGALKGLFSVSSDKQVRFSQGNLQYSTLGSHLCIDGTTKVGTWRFADNQYDYIGSQSQFGQYNNDAKGNVAENDNAYIGSGYEGWIDLLGWGTSGYHDERDVNCSNYYPYSNLMIATDVESNKYGYGPSFNLTDKNLTASNAYYDWGVYNAISNGGNEVGAWRTLTADEWNYLCNGRPDASSKWGYATVNGVKGVVVLPDKWILPHSCTFVPGKINMWATNSYTQLQWEDMESLGALFLPAAGLRYESMSVNVGNHASYWSSSAFSGSDAYGVDFSNVPNFSYNTYRFNGLSVRLVSE